MNFNNLGEKSWKVMIFLWKYAGPNNKIYKIYQEVATFSYFRWINIFLIFKV